MNSGVQSAATTRCRAHTCPAHPTPTSPSPSPLARTLALVAVDAGGVKAASRRPLFRFGERHVMPPTRNGAQRTRGAGADVNGPQVAKGDVFGIAAAKDDDVLVQRDKGVGVARGRASRMVQALPQTCVQVINPRVVALAMGRGGRERESFSVGPAGQRACAELA